MVRKLNSIFLVNFLLISVTTFSQVDDNPTHPKFKDFKNDSTFQRFSKLREPVARAQVVSLKNGALLVRLKTNSATISRLKSAGNIDLATQGERETFLANKLIIRAYKYNFDFCPVYFFTADFSDSVKHKNIKGIFVDSNLVRNESIVCDAAFYLVAEQGSVYDSSLGMLTELQAQKATEKGTPVVEATVVFKNRYFFQLNKPFPYYQQGHLLKKIPDHVKRMNKNLHAFYEKSKDEPVSPEIKQYVY